MDSDFFDLFGIPVIAGPTFGPRDDPKTSVIVSRRLAEKMYGALDAVGQPFPKTRPGATIIGVVDDAQTMNVNDREGAQRYVSLRPDGFGDYRLVVRAKNDPRLLMPLLKLRRKQRIETFFPRSDCFATTTSKNCESIGRLI